MAKSYVVYVNIGNCTKREAKAILKQHRKIFKKDANKKERLQHACRTIKLI